MHAGEHVLDRAQVAVEAKRLKSAGHAQAGHRVRRPSGQFGPTGAFLQSDTARLWSYVAGHEVDQCRLAGAVRPDQAKDGALLDLQRHIVDGAHAAERALEISELQQAAQALSSVSTSAAR